MGVLKNIREKLSRQIRIAVEGIYGEIEVPPVKIKQNIQSGYGEFTSTIAFQVSKIIGHSPIVIGEKIKESVAFQEGWIARVDLAGDGFLNFYLNPSWKVLALEEIVEGTWDSLHCTRAMDTIQNVKHKVGEERWRLFETEGSYVVFRGKWVLDRYKKEGILPKVENVRWEEMREEVERGMINQIMLYLDIFEQEGHSEKSFLALEKLCNTFMNHQQHIVMRRLQDPQRNVILSIMATMVKILEVWLGVLSPGQL